MTEYKYLHFESSKAGKFEFYFYYSDYSNLQDLLEYIIYNFPEKKICLCDRFKGITDYSTKVKDYIKNNNTFKIWNPNTICKCDESTKNNIKKSKKDIIKEINICQNNLKKKDKEIETCQKNLKEKEKEIETCQKNLKKKDKEIQTCQNNLKEKEKEIETCQNNLKEKEKEIQTYQNLKEKEEEIHVNDERLNQKDKIIKSYEEKLKEKDNEIKSLNKEIENLKQNIGNLEKEINDNRQLITSLQKDNSELKNEINGLNSKEQLNENALKEEINKLNKEKKLLEIAINGDINKINQLRNLGVTSDFLKPKENLISIDPETNKIISKEILNKGLTFIDFYDVIIDIQSIKDINKGWEIKMSQRAKENYNSLKKEKIIKIGVIGNSNKGKSFLLSKISKIDLPSGTSIRTEGLSVKYPDLTIYTNRKIVLLDSAGLETPVLKEEDDTKAKKEENIDIKTKGEPEELNEEEFENDDKSKKEIFKEKSREKIITELFLQNYIIYNTNILIIVVGILTYSEQKLINRIKTEIQRSKVNRKLFIIHNLITYTTKEQIEEYINKYLLKSATFNLEEGHYINTLREGETGLYFYEKNTEPKIYHLIFANDGSEAGEYYNNFTLKFIENQYSDVTDLKSFDVIETVKDKFLEISREILEKIDSPFQKGDFEDSNLNSIKLKNIKNIQLKKCLIDELGFSNLKTNGFEPTYNCYKKDDKIIIRVEAPGNSKIKTNILHSGEYTIIRIDGMKRKDKEPESPEDNLFNSREIGDFSFDIPLKTDDYLVKNVKPKIEEKKGLIILEFQLEDKNTEADFGSDLNDDV